MHEPEEELAVRERTLPVEDVRTWQQQLLRGVLRALVIIGVPALVLGSYSAYETQDMWLIPLYLAAYAILLVITLWRRVSYATQAWTIVSVIYGMGVLELADTGLGGDGRIYLLTLPILAALFLGRRQSVLAMVVATLTLAAFGWGYSTGRFVPTVEIQEITTDPTWWFTSVISLVLLGTTLLISQNYLMPRLADALARSRRLAQALEAYQATLEEQVAERTAALARRSTQLEAAAQVAREAAEIRDVVHLLEETARLISDRFGFYHAGIFLLDEAGEYAVLHATSSQGGQRMLTHGHRLRVGEEGIVGHVTGQGKPRIALDVGADAVFFDNPYLPDTRSEMALPLRAQGQIIGTLDVQSTEPEAFTDEDIAVLQTLADQLAMAISNARLFQQAQESLEAERRAYDVLSHEAWRALVRTQPDLRHQYDPQGILPNDGPGREEPKLAVRNGKTVLGGTIRSATVSTPIKVRDRVIGVLDAYKPEGAGAWAPEEIALLETLTEQLGIALESARLYQDTQRRAARERLTGEITDRMRETLDVDTVLQTAVREMRQILDLAEAEVRLGIGPVSGKTGGSAERGQA
jgi:GAF domain-containing protein